MVGGEEKPSTLLPKKKKDTDRTQQCENTIRYSVTGVIPIQYL